jgi:hypothetical protein
VTGFTAQLHTATGSDRDSPALNTDILCLGMVLAAWHCQWRGFLDDIYIGIRNALRFLTFI